MTNKFKVNPTYQKHQTSELAENLNAVRESEIFFIFGNKGYVNGCKKIGNGTLPLIQLATQLGKPFILCLDNSLPLDDQKYLRQLCPSNNTQVFSFNPEKYSDMELHKRMMVIINGAINKEVITDPFEE